MMKQFLHKFVALLAVCALVLVSAFPAMAGGEEYVFEGMTAGEYRMTYVRFEVPTPTGEIGLSGPAVDDYGSVAMEEGKSYDFTWTQNFTAGESTYYGVNMKPQVGYFPLSISTDSLIPIDGRNMFGLQTEGADTTITVTFNGVELYSYLTLYADGSAYGPTMNLDGQISVEVTTSIDGYFTVDDLSPEVSDDFTVTNIDKINSVLSEMATATRGGSNNGTMFSSPQEITYRIDLDGMLVGFGTEYWAQDMNIGFSVVGEHDYTVQFQGETYKTLVRDEKATNGSVDFTTFSMDGLMTIYASNWTFVAKDLHDVSEPIDDSTVTVGEALTITAGAGAAALGGSALVSVLGDTVGSAASNMLIPDPTVIDPTVPDPTVPDIPEADLPTDKKKQDQKDKEEGCDTKAEDDRSDTPENDTAMNNIEENDIPDLPDEDTPEVSMSLYAPGSDLLNIKGGAADLTITINGGEEYVWNYLPAVIAPGAAKSIVPTVTGRSHLATLALNITGAATEERHHVVFVNVIAWTTTPDGKLLKASASKEMKLHTPGIEAKRDAEGNITVTAYSDTTLKGYAEIRKLSAEEYILEMMEDESIRIHANDVKLGTTSLKKS